MQITKTSNRLINQIERSLTRYSTYRYIGMANGHAFLMHTSYYQNPDPLMIESVLTKMDNGIMLTFDKNNTKIVKVEFKNPGIHGGLGTYLIGHKQEVLELSKALNVLKQYM